MSMLTNERECDRCYGMRHNSDGSRCWHCRGTGRDLTELGREIIAFVEEHFDIKAATERQETP